MNKTAIKNFAIWARVQLIEAAKQRAYEYEITENGENKFGLDMLGGRLLTKTEKEQRNQLVSEINRKGFSQVMEEVAYTWFNRFIALRFMEVNGYLPSKIRVFTDENGAFKPEILKEAMNVELDGLDRNIVLNLLDKQDNEALYKYLLITQCNALNADLPYMFEKIANWSELLFPANLLRSDSIIGRMVNEIPEEDFKDEVEIIGWLYQFYITEKHEEVIDPLHGKIIKKEDIPAATQLFTTDWVVRYILDNSLGRYWIERHPESQLASKLTYLVTPKDGSIETVNETISPEELKVLDPCVGSGHFLSYAFDILLEIYRECGWSDRDAAKSILENNLHGLDIDDRAAQLACFAIAMKARKYNRRILNGETTLNIFAMQDSDLITEDIVRYFAGKDEKLRNDINELRITFNNAKEYGSIITIPKLDFAALYERIDIISRSFAEDIFKIGYQNTVIEQLLTLVKQAEIVSQKYDIVATNPPYMNKYSPRLKDYINQYFADYKGDLFSVFMYRNFGFCKENGYSGFMTPNVWMFIKTYENLRNYIINEKAIVSLIQMGNSAFEEASVAVCAFVFRNNTSNTSGIFIKLSDFKGNMASQREKYLEALGTPNCPYRFDKNTTLFLKMPGSKIAYWLGERVFQIMGKEYLGSVSDARIGLVPGNNEKYIRFWFEVSYMQIGFDFSKDLAAASMKTWFPYDKGGAFNKWYGNQSCIVNWKNDGYEMQTTKYPDGSRIWAHNFNLDYIFKPHISCSAISGDALCFRYFPRGFIFDSASTAVFLPEEKIKYVLGLVNSKVIQYISNAINPTINFKPGDFASLPLIEIDNKNAINYIVESLIKLAKIDDNSVEQSWNFKKHPLV